MRIRKSIYGVFSEEEQRLTQRIYHLLYLIWTVTLFSCSSKVSSDIPKELFANKLIPSVEAFDFQTYYTDSAVFAGNSSGFCFRCD